MTILVGGRKVLIALLAFFPLMAFAESVTVIWEDNSSDEAGFKVERGTDGKNFVEIASVSANVTSFVDSTTSSSTKYYYRVAAFDATRKSAYSNVTSVTTAAATVAPTFTVQPTASQTVNAGAKVVLSVSAKGVPSPSYQWKKNGTAIAGATGSTLTLTSVVDSDAGNYSAVASNSAGSISSSNALVVVQTIAVTPPPVVAPPPATTPPPVVTQPPVSESPQVSVVVPTVPPTESTTPEAQPAQTPVTPAPDQTSVVEISAPVIKDSPQLIDSGADQTLVSKTDPKKPGNAKTSAEVESSGSTVASRLVNLSVRSIPGPDDRALLVGFVVKDAPKMMLLRAVGPGLKTYTNVATYEDPKLAINDGHRDIAVNDNWGGSEELRNSFLRVGAFPLSDSSTDAAILTKLTPKSYTANIAGSGSGLALAEIYDADAALAPSGRLINVSARAYAGPGDGVLIIGFVISGDTPLRVLVRGIGPSLVNQGVKAAAVLANPQIDLYRGNTLIQHNDDWAGTSDLSAAFAQTGAFKLSGPQSKDAAMVATLSPGMYSLVVSGAGSTAGVALAEVYQLP